MLSCDSFSQASLASCSAFFNSSSLGILTDDHRLCVLCFLFFLFSWTLSVLCVATSSNPVACGLCRRIFHGSNKLLQLLLDLAHAVRDHSLACTKIHMQCSAYARLSYQLVHPSRTHICQKWYKHSLASSTMRPGKSMLPVSSTTEGMSLRRNTNRQRAFERDAFILACHVAQNTFTPNFVQKSMIVYDSIVLQWVLTRNSSVDSNLHIHFECTRFILQNCHYVTCVNLLLGHGHALRTASTVNFTWHDVKDFAGATSFTSAFENAETCSSRQAETEYVVCSLDCPNPDHETKRPQELNHDCFWLHSVDVLPFGSAHYGWNTISSIWSHSCLIFAVKFCLSCLSKRQLT